MAEDLRIRRRTRLRPRFVDVTGDDGPAAPHPDVVHAFEEVGYAQVALVRFGVEPGGFPALVDGYAPEDRAEMIEHLAEPHTLLRSADGLVLARVGWFWSWPGVELLTLMSDGARVETQRRWDAVPPWPLNRRAQHRFATVEGEMTRAAARGRSVAVVDEVLALSEHATEHAWAVARTHARVGNVVVFALVFVWVLAFMFLLDALRAPWWALALGAVTVLAIALGRLNRFAVRFAYSRWWRPAYRPLRA